jgi:hypothetical protein
MTYSKYTTDDPCEVSKAEYDWAYEGDRDDVYGRYAEEEFVC